MNVSLVLSTWFTSLTALQTFFVCLSVMLVPMILLTYAPRIFKTVQGPIEPAPRNGGWGDHGRREIKSAERKYDIQVNAENVSTLAAFLLTTALYTFLFVGLGWIEQLQQHHSTAASFGFGLSFFGVMYVIYRAVLIVMLPWMSQFKDRKDEIE